MQNSNADSILKEIEELQKNNPKSSEWELKLVKEVHVRTNLLDAAEFTHLETLQQHRHLSAHPILTGTYQLYSPNRETARAHIRNVLEALLTKPPLLTRKVFDSLMEDIARTKNILTDDNSLQRYLDAKYFGRLARPVEDSIFRSLWKLVFRSDDPQCEVNRRINLRALKILFRRRPSDFGDRIANEQSFYSDIGTTGTRIDSLIEFLSEFPQVFRSLNDAARVPLQNAITDGDRAALAWFVSGDLKTHLIQLAQKIISEDIQISVETFQHIYNLAQNDGIQELALNIGVQMYIRSKDFDQADANFEGMLEPHLEYLTSEQAITCLNGIENNSQTHWRARARSDHQLLKNALDKILGPNFDYSAYPKFKGNLQNPKKV